MKKEEYLKILTEQIRCKMARQGLKRRSGGISKTRKKRISVTG